MLWSVSEKFAKSTSILFCCSKQPLFIPSSFASKEILLFVFLEMLQLLPRVCSDVYNFLIGNNAVQDSKNAGDCLGNVEEKYKSKDPNQDKASSEASDEPSSHGDSNSVSRNNKTIYGKVTSLYSGRGLIDDYIYFSQETVVGNARLRVGTKVIVDATRSSEQAGWLAKRVALFNEWNLDSEAEETFDEINGLITYFSGVSGLINDRYSFSKASCNGTYHPMVNDFVTCKIHIVGGEDGDVVSVKPLREKEFIGFITNVIGKYGFIDEDIFFPIGACRGYRPRIGDCVLVTAIEAKQRKSQWRAYKVEKCTEDMK